MFPLWDSAIAPVLTAARVRRVVEIGALRGETTVRVLETLGPEAEFHVIDPAPDFDPSEHERDFPGRYFFHRALSLDVLPTLAPMDAALIDGDHNWYTVHNELQLLARTSREAGAPLPLLVLHDVGWPYGRRDLYYDPDTVPEEHRQPYARAGMRPGTRRLLPGGGLNPTMYNAEMEGGPRNGVMTALDDFIAGYDKPLRLIFLPIYFGLAIVAEEERLQKSPELAAAFARLESAEGRLELMKVAEDVRLRAMIFQHNVFYRRNESLERTQAKYLKLIKDALLDRHYLDNEVRLDHLLERQGTTRPLNVAHLRDPTRYERVAYDRLTAGRFGPAGPDSPSEASFLPYTSMGRGRLDHLEQSLDALRSEGIDGDLVECGTGRGGGAIFLRAYLEVHEDTDTAVWVFDRFRAAPEPDLAPTLGPEGFDGLQADLNMVRDGFDRFDLLDEQVRFVQGPPASGIPSSSVERLALLRIGASAGPDVTAVLDLLHGKVVEGGFIIIELGGPETLDAVERFRAAHGVASPLEHVDSGCVAWRSPGQAAEPSAAAPDVADPAADRAAVDLTIVVVFYNMRREAARTLHALSRSYQEGTEDFSYEVLAIENGSAPDQKLGADFVEAFGPEFRYLDMGPDASPSPVRALNRGIAEGRGESFALMIDGAHVVTPGVLRYGLLGLRTFAPSVVATQQWYIGPGQQGEAMDDGYDTDYEDGLFESIGWPREGYRLFDIGHFVGDRDWFDGMWESNCIFTSRALLEQSGVFDEAFSMPGGGYANLELYERLGSSPGVTVTTILGEGSFHQVHGGTTTNQSDAEERRARVFGYGAHFAEQRGRPFRGPGKPIHYVGHMASPSARRTKARRRTGEAFLATNALVQGDGPAEHPTPMPAELATLFTEAVWRTVPWDHTSWLGRRVRTAPTDLFAYQEIVADVRPDWIVEIGAGDPGRSLFFASMCDLVGHGRVLTVDDPLPDDWPDHDRLDRMRARAHSRPAVERVSGVVGGGRVVVVLGSCSDRTSTAAQFRHFAPLVPVGSYVIVSDTIVNGNPVWPAFGPGPAEAVAQILSKDGSFVADPQMEKYSLTFNPNGFLKRIR